MASLYFLYHVPKTGGQTVRDHLVSHLERDVEFLHLGRWDRPARLEMDDVASRSPDAKDRLRVLSGHPLTREYASLFPDRRVREVIFFREPAARLVSLYNFRSTLAARRGEPIEPFERFLDDAPSRTICKPAAQAAL